MAITITEGAAIPKRRYTAGNIPNARYRNAFAGIHHLDYADLFGAIGTILNEPDATDTNGVRIDRQSPPAGGGANLQVQLNGVTPTTTQGTTIAAVLLDASLNGYGGATQVAQQNHILSKVKHAFFNSLHTQNKVSITGTPP